MKKYYPDNLCEYCQAEGDRNVTQYSSGCEGRFCEEAYDHWVEEVGELEVAMLTIEKC